MKQKAPYDIWSYEVKITKKLDPGAALERLLDNLEPSTDEIKKIMITYDQVIINCYLRSDFAQMGFELSKRAIKQLSDFGIGLDIHFLSWGGAE